MPKQAKKVQEEQDAVVVNGADVTESDVEDAEPEMDSWGEEEEEEEETSSDE